MRSQSRRRTGPRPGGHSLTACSDCVNVIGHASESRLQGSARDDFGGVGDRVIEPLPGVRVPAALRPDRPGDAPATDPDALAATLRTLWRLPKVELHLHPEGTLRPETVCELASRYEPHSPLCRPDWQRGYWSFHDLTGFVDQFRGVLRTCLRGADDYYRLAVEAFEDLAAQQVVYAELSVSARAPSRPEYVPLAEMLSAIDRARRAVEARTPLRVGLLLGLTRAQPSVADADTEALAFRFVEEAAQAREAGAAIFGIDLHGDEQAAPDVTSFVAAYRAAEEAGLGLRAHAGEGRGPATVWESLRRLGVRRIAHGVRATEDPTLVAHLARTGVPLDVCPTSNVLTGTVPSLEHHPVRALHEAGVVVTVSSDDPLIFDTSLTAELALVHHRLGFSLAELGQLTTQAAAHSFLPDSARSALVDCLCTAWLRRQRRPEEA